MPYEPGSKFNPEGFAEEKIDAHESGEVKGFTSARGEELLKALDADDDIPVDFDARGESKSGHADNSSLEALDNHPDLFAGIDATDRAEEIARKLREQSSEDENQKAA